MAAVFMSQTASDIAVPATSRTLLQIVAASNHRLMISEISVTFDGQTSGNKPALVELIRQTSAGTGGSNENPVKINAGDDEALQATGLKNIVTSEPAGTTVIDAERIHPQAGKYFFKASGEDRIAVKGGDRLGIRIKATDSVNATLHIKAEE